MENAATRPIDPVEVGEIRSTISRVARAPNIYLTHSAFVSPCKALRPVLFLRKVAQQAVLQRFHLKESAKSSAGIGYNATRGLASGPCLTTVTRRSCLFTRKEHPTRTGDANWVKQRRSPRRILLRLESHARNRLWMCWYGQMTVNPNSWSRI